MPRQTGREFAGPAVRVEPVKEVAQCRHVPNGHSWRPVRGRAARMSDRGPWPRFAVPVRPPHWTARMAPSPAGRDLCLRRRPADRGVRRPAGHLL